MTTPTKPEPNDTDLALALQPFTETIEAAAAAVGPARDQIGQTLEELWQEGADESRLTVIQTKADQLVSAISHLNKAATVGLNAAQKALEQRDAAVSELEDLRDAVLSVDTENDLVGDLYEAVQSDTEEMLMQGYDESLTEMMVDNTPFDYQDVSFIDDIFYHGMLDMDSPLWEEFKAWLIKARDEIASDKSWYRVRLSFEKKD